MLRLIAIGAALGGAGCTSIAPPPPITGGEWRVTAINGRVTPPLTASYRMTFEPRSLGGQFGCNHFGGDYRVSGDVLTTGAVAMTEMACDGPASSFESWGLAIIQRPMRLEWVSASRITLTNEDDAAA